MTAVIDEAVDDFSDINPEEVAAAPLSGSRGTRRKRGAANTSPDEEGSSSAPRIQRRGVRLERKLNELQTRLSGEMFTAGIMIGLPLPITGYYVCQESDSFTKAVVELAAKKPEWLDALENVANIAPGLVIGRTAFGVGIALAADRERIDFAKRETMLKLFGVWSAIEKVKGGQVGDFKPAEGSSYRPPPARSFVPL